MVELDEPSDLAELNRLFAAWVETDYHDREHSETKARPLERLLAAGAPQLPGPELVREAFLWSEQRTVTKTATVSLHGNRYEVDAALVGRRCELVFDPFDLTRIEVRWQERPFGLAIAVEVGRHVHPKARSEPEPPVSPSGIDYLELLAERRDRELRGSGIDYREIDDEQENKEQEKSG